MSGLAREIDALVPVFVALGAREAASDAVLLATTEELPGALAAWRAAESELIDARLAEVTA